MSAKTDAAKERIRKHTGRALPLGAPDLQAPLHALVDALLDVLPPAQADALADALEARLK